MLIISALAFEASSNHILSGIGKLIFFLHSLVLSVCSYLGCSYCCVSVTKLYRTYICASVSQIYVLLHETKATYKLKQNSESLPETIAG